VQPAPFRCHSRPQAAGSRTPGRVGISGGFTREPARPVVEAAGQLEDQVSRRLCWRPTATRIGTRSKPSSGRWPGCGRSPTGPPDMAVKHAQRAFRHRDSSPRQAWNRLRGTACSTPLPRRSRRRLGAQSVAEAVSQCEPRTLSLPRGAPPGGSEHNAMLSNVRDVRLFRSRLRYCRQCPQRDSNLFTRTGSVILKAD